jgi:hypothetical protein
LVSAGHKSAAELITTERERQGMMGSVSRKLALNLPASNPPGYPWFDMRSDQPPQLTSGSPSSAQHVNPATTGHRQSGKTIAAEPGEE